MRSRRTLSTTRHRLAVVALVLAAFIGIALLAFTAGGNTTDRAEAATGGPEMALNVKNGACDDLVRPTTCDIPSSSTFTLSIDALGIPTGGYVAVYAYLDFGSKLSYNPATNIADEIVWPAADPARSFSSAAGSEIGIAGLMGFTLLIFPPLTSTYVGTLFEFQMACPNAGSSQTTVDLLAFDPEGVHGGTWFLEPDTTIPEMIMGVPKLGSLNINCVVPPKLPYPGDTDGDGCPDERESRPKAELANGGGRDYLNPWDWYDVNQDGVIDLLNDVLGVIQHFSPQGGPPYDIAFDRGPVPPGASPGNMTAPDGVIDLLNDILGVIRQHGHDCT